MQFDSFDRALLLLVQQNNRLSNEAMANQVALSPSAVRRRLKALRESGVIARDVSILSADQIGFRVIVMVRCNSEDSHVYENFKTRMRACEEVLECYSTSGEADFIVIAQLPNMPAYNRWIYEHIVSDPDLNRCDTHFVFETVKYQTAIPVG